MENVITKLRIQPVPNTLLVKSGKKTEVVKLNAGPGVNINPSKIPDFVYNQDEAGYASLFSARKVPSGLWLN